MARQDDFKIKPSGMREWKAVAALRSATALQNQAESGSAKYVEIEAARAERRALPRSVEFFDFEGGSVEPNFATGGAGFADEDDFGGAALHFEVVGEFGPVGVAGDGVAARLIADGDADAGAFAFVVA